MCDCDAKRKVKPHSHSHSHMDDDVYLEIIESGIYIVYYGSYINNERMHALSIISTN